MTRTRSRLRRLVVASLLLASASVASAQTHDPPFEVAAVAREPGKVALTWRPADENKGVRVVEYEVWRTGGPIVAPVTPAPATPAPAPADAEEVWARVGSTAGAITWWTDTQVTAGARYGYRIVSKAVTEAGAGLPVGLARRESSPVHDVLALAGWYVELESVDAEQPDAATAVLRVHRWQPDAAAWVRGPAARLGRGEPIGKDELEGDFTTGATVDQAWAVAATDGKQPPVGWVRYRQADGALVETSTLEDPPEAVYVPVDRPRRSRNREEERTRARARRDAAPRIGSGVRATRFPEPTRVESVTGNKVLWEIVNGTSHELTVYYSGPSTGRVTIPPGETSVIRIARGGDVTVTGNCAKTDRVAPCTGRYSLVSGVRYRSSFATQAVDKP